MRTNGMLLLLAGLLMVGCTPETKQPIYAGIFSTNPVNLADFNSPYDDYNSYGFTTTEASPLVFSSNRNSAGQNFDFVYKLLYVSTDRFDPATLIKVEEYSNTPFGSNYTRITDALPVINSPADELGPYMVHQAPFLIKDSAGRVTDALPSLAFLYATNQTGNLDIRYTENGFTSSYTTPKDLAFLNSPKDDAYPCILPDTSAIYFCSNRDGNFDIYKANIAAFRSFRSVLKETDNKNILVTKDATLSSPYEDKCPFIMGKLMIFTSNRPGGFGGFDLYYSKLENNGRWSVPVNFGPKINTAADEYRPILVSFSQINIVNDMMVFSSNRAGGKGGFDLYYVGIDKMTF